MRAIVVTKPGGPDVLALREVETPSPSRGEVRVRVRATAVNRADVMQRMGHYPAPADAPADIPGLEFAGVVDALGEAVTGWQRGDRVFGLAGGGTYAEYVVVHERTLARIPDILGDTDAAAVPEAFITAYDAIVTQAGLAAGEFVLVHAVGSGVGTAAIQIALAIGARAIGTARTKSKIDRARPLGLAEGIVVDDGAFAEKVMRATGGRGVDVVLELVGGAYVPEDIAAVAPGGRIVVVGLLAGRSAAIDLGTLLRRRLTITGTVLRSRPLEEKIAATNAFARHVVPLLGGPPARGSGAEGGAPEVRPALRAIVDRVMPLVEAAEAHRYVESNAGFGKVVLAVD